MSAKKSVGERLPTDENTELPTSSYTLMYVVKFSSELFDATARITTSKLKTV